MDAQIDAKPVISMCKCSELELSVYIHPLSSTPHNSLSLSHLLVSSCILSLSLFLRSLSSHCSTTINLRQYITLWQRSFARFESNAKWPSPKCPVPLLYTHKTGTHTFLKHIRSIRTQLMHFSIFNLNTIFQISRTYSIL